MKSMSDHHVTPRLQFMGIDQRQQNILGSIKPLIGGYLDRGLKRFYVTARATPETAKFFRDDNHMAKAKTAQESHWLRIASGKFDADFYSSVRRIGSVHARIGLEPQWYVGAYALVVEELLRGVAKSCSPWRRLLTLFQRPSASEASIAVVKAALLDLELSISIYFEQGQIERDEAIAQFGSIMSSSIGRLADGDLTGAITGDVPEALIPVKSSFNEALHKLRGLIGGVSQSTVNIGSSSSEIAQASEDLARRTESNAASLEETSAALTQMDTRLKATATSSSKTVTRADQAIATVAGGRLTAEEAVEAMGRVSDSAKGIDSVIEGLDKIAFQTRVLAMNAAVEAGRAGDAGRGFAVVADLVSALAMRAEEEAKRARDQLTVTQTDIVTAVQAVQKVDGALANISSDVGEVHKLLGTMADDATAQSSAITQITAAIGAMDQSTQQNAAMVEETSAAARNLTAEVTSLAEQAAMFKTGEGTTPRPVAVAPVAPSPARAKARSKAAPYVSPVKALAAPASAADDWNDF